MSCLLQTEFLRTDEVNEIRMIVQPLQRQIIVTHGYRNIGRCGKDRARRAAFL